MTVTVQADARRLPLPDESVDLIVTSPPYFALRSYTDDGEHYAGQIGSEDTPQEYIAALLDCTREWVRVLKPSGSLFVDLGDKYSQRTQTRRSSHQPGMFPGKFDEFGETWAERAANGAVRMPHQNVVNDAGAAVPEKSLMLLPERYRIACVDELGLIARAVLVWSKPNGLPESVTDRVRRSHEDWVHLTRRPRYYSAVDEIRTPHAEVRTGLAGTFKRPNGSHDLVPGQSARQHRDDRKDESAYNPLGALPGSVWSIPTEPLTLPAFLDVDHFAAFPSEWPRRLILGWSPPGICVECGEGRRPVVDKTTPSYRSNDHTGAADERGVGGSSALRVRGGGPTWNRLKAENPDTITGYDCDCPTPDAPTRPAVVLDPCGGAGTTAAVAQALGRTGISVDLSHDYCRVARWRGQDTALAGKVQGRMWRERQGTLGI